MITSFRWSLRVIADIFQNKSRLLIVNVPKKRAARLGF